MTRTPIAALVVLLAACASGGAGGDTRPTPANTVEAGDRVTVRVENGTTDQLRITGRGASSLRLQAGQTGCLRLSPTAGRMTLLAEPLGGGENRTGISTRAPPTSSAARSSRPPRPPPGSGRSAAAA